MSEPTLNVIGGGLSGCEAAWQAAERGVQVRLYEMRPHQKTEAHVTDQLGELVCSGSLGSKHVDRPTGLLKEELRLMDSLLIDCAEASSVPAGGALAVDRIQFAEMITKRIQAHPKIDLIREEIKDLPEGPTVLASGPLTSEDLSESLAKFTSCDHLFFFDAISPICTQESIDMSLAYRGSRYQKGEDDYINCPLNRQEYNDFIDALLQAERIPLHSFEKAMESGVKAGFHHFFEGCLPIEILASRGRESMAFGPMRPVGLQDPRTGRRPHAVLQLRQDDVAGELYNLVGFQTNLKFPEQKRVFGMIPGLANADWVRYGQMHRNTFISAPELLESSLQFKARQDLWCAGQLCGVEGYAGNIGTGLIAGINATRFIKGKDQAHWPKTTMIGALCHYITHTSLKNFQPMKANFGLLPRPEGLPPKTGKRERAAAMAQAALRDLKQYNGEIGEVFDPVD